ncbi:MAG: PhnD/SsuA/transferrin family substrate-binding protein, partial [Duodenibacillus sp.]|nr:PhnD/SsuA/transferrin family substrate-binding protein [Duodenibacillus sp.]
MARVCAAALALCAALAAGPAAAADGRPVVRIGLADTFPPGFYIDAYAPTVQYLKRRLPGHRFESVEFPSVKEMLAAGPAGLDMIVSSSGDFGILQHAWGVEHLAIRKPDSAARASASTAAVFAVRADRAGELRSLADLKGKSVAAGSDASFSGWLAALDEIAAAGHDPYRFFGSVRMTGYQYPDVISLLRLGAVSAGVLPRCALEEAVAAR